MKNKRDQIYDIRTEQIIPNPNQPRRTFSEASLKELAESIKQFGVIQPIVVRKIDSELFELVSGERRLRASVLAGKKTIPALMSKISEKDSAVIAVVENIQREDLHFFEEAESYRQLMENYGLTQEEIAKMVGKSQSFVANKLRLLKMDPKVIEMIRAKSLSERHARALLRIPDSDIQLQVIDKVAAKGMTVKKTEDLVEKIRNEALTNNYDEKITPGKKARVKSFINAQIYVNTIKSAFKTVQELKKNAEYSESNQEEYVEIRIRIPK